MSEFYVSQFMSKIISPIWQLKTLSANGELQIIQAVENGKHLGNASVT
jgi:hypothetical protein